MSIRRLISLLVVLTSILLITGCSGSKEIKFPAEKEDIEKAILKYNLGWTVEEERLEDAELSTSGQGIEEKQDDDEQKNILFSDDYKNLYYNVWFREKGKNEIYTSDDDVTETESIDWDNAATIALSNQAGSEFFLEGLSRHIDIE